MPSSSGEIPKHSAMAIVVGPLLRHGAMRSGCWLIPTKLSSFYLHGKENSQVSLNHTFLGLLYVSQVSQGSPRFSAELEAACGCHSEEGSQSVSGPAGGPVVQCGA